MRRFTWPIILAVAGIVLIVAGGGWLVSRIAGLAEMLPVASWQAPGEGTMTLVPGEYAVSELVGYSFGSDTTPGFSGYTLDATDITITGPDGPVAVRCANCGFTYEEVSVGNDVFQAVAHFDARTDGDYTVSITSDGANVAVTPSVGQMFSSMAPTFAPMGIGGLLLLAAIIWALIAAFTGKKPQAPAPVAAGTYLQPTTIGGYPTAPPTTTHISQRTQVAPPSQPVVQQPGWYPDPADPSQKRWWDGNGWSDQTYRG